MKPAKIKTHVLFVSRTFPCYHPRKGEETYFPELISLETDNLERSKKWRKIHTIRENYEDWKRKIDEVNAGTAVLVLKYWSGRPYWTTPVEFARLTKAGIQRISIDFRGYDSCVMDQQETEFKLVRNSEISSNDSLSDIDFRAWFKAKKNPNFTGCVIHFTDFRY